MRKFKSPEVGPITAEQIDRRFYALERFAADSWSNIKIVERIRKLRLDVRRLHGTDGYPLDDEDGVS